MAPFLRTDTSEQQHELELKVSELYQDLADADEADREEMLLLLRDRHTRYLQGGLGQLPAGFVSLDASRPWICYWVLHGLALLQAPLPADIPASEVVAFLSSCQHPAGGYGGGPGQLAHLAPTYAVVSALLTLGGEEALGSIDRQGVWQFLKRMVIPPAEGGGFRMHDGGESDVRSCYTAMAVATGLGLDAQGLATDAGMVDYIRRCQTYEGGIGGEPGNEAHGGYTYCGLAALALAGCPQALDLHRLLHWVVQRQGWVEGGFNGRTNKLVDGCYSFWQGGVFPILQQLVQQELPQQVHPELNVSCSSKAYPPATPPQHWQQEQQQQQQQQQALEVPEPPDLSLVLGPVEQAEAEAQRANAAFEALAEAALATSTPAEGAEQQDGQAAGNEAAAAGTTPATAATAAGDEGIDALGTRAAESKVELLQRAEAAEQAANYAEELADIAGLSAAVMFPCSQPATAAAGPEAHAAASSSGSSEQQGAPSAANPLFNTRALQLWVLRGCQQLKGGLRDKPGKAADYYHTCYCLSGLSAAQHIMGGCVVGPPEPVAQVFGAAAGTGRDVAGGSSSSSRRGEAATAAAGGSGGSGAAGGGSSGSSGSSGGGSAGAKPCNLLAAADPLLNVVVDRVREAKQFFEQAEPVV